MSVPVGSHSENFIQKTQSLLNAKKLNYEIKIEALASTFNVIYGVVRPQNYCLYCVIHFH